MTIKISFFFLKIKRLSLPKLSLFNREIHIMSQVLGIEPRLNQYLHGE